MRRDSSSAPVEGPGAGGTGEGLPEGRGERNGQRGRAELWRAKAAVAHDV